MIIHVNEFYVLLNYLIAIVVSILIAIMLRLPIFPEKPRRFSWTKSVLFPTPIISIGFLAIFYSTGFYWIYNGIILATLIGILSPLFVKYLFDYIFPKPPVGDDGSE
jgi:energy-converting hydrogenase A subunit A